MQIELGPGIVGHEQDVPEAVVGEEEDQLEPAYVAGDPLEAGLEFRVAEGRGIDRVIERRKAEGLATCSCRSPASTTWKQTTSSRGPS